METHSKLPIIFTKDAGFLDTIQGNVFAPGSVIVLPADAIVVFEEVTVSQAVVEPLNIEFPPESLPPVTEIYSEDFANRMKERAENGDMWPEVIPGAQFETGIDKSELNVPKLPDDAPKEATKITVTTVEDEPETKTVWGVYAISKKRDQGFSEIFETHEEASRFSQNIHEGFSTYILEQTYAPEGPTEILDEDEEDVAA